MREPRTISVVVRVTEKDHAAIVRAAAKHDMTLSEFVRAACLTWMAVDCDRHALKLLASGAADALMEAAKKFTAAVKGSEEKWARRRAQDGMTDVTKRVTFSG